MTMRRESHPDDSCIPSTTMKHPADDARLAEEHKEEIKVSSRWIKVGNLLWLWENQQVGDNFKRPCVKAAVKSADRCDVCSTRLCRHNASLSSVLQLRLGLATGTMEDVAGWLRSTTNGGGSICFKQMCCSYSQYKLAMNFASHLVPYIEMDIE